MDDALLQMQSQVLALGSGDLIELQMAYDYAKCA